MDTINIQYLLWSICLEMMVAINMILLFIFISNKGYFD
jgi:hypothetical protein